MKKVFVITLIIFFSLTSYAQKHFINLIAGYSTISPNQTAGYFVHADYTSRILGIFRYGLGLASNSFMYFENGFLSHENNLDAEAKIGLSFKLLGFRLEAGLGSFGRYWDRSYATDGQTQYSFIFQGRTVILNPGEIRTYKYFSFGGFSYASVGLEVSDWLGVKFYAQYKREKTGDNILDLGGGLYFMVGKK